MGSVDDAPQVGCVLPLNLQECDAAVPGLTRLGDVTRMGKPLVGAQHVEALTEPSQSQQAMSLPSTARLNRGDRLQVERSVSLDDGFLQLGPKLVDVPHQPTRALGPAAQNHRPEPMLDAVFVAMRSPPTIGLRSLC